MVNMRAKHLHIEVIGNGPDLVLIHGWGMSSAVWQTQVKVLANHYTLHLVDLPGMGLSQPCDPYHLEAMAGIIALALPAGANILGWSLGGLVAMRIAMDSPEKVKKLVLVGSTPCFVNRPDWALGIPAHILETFASNMRADYHSTLTQFLTLQCMGAKEARETVKILRSNLAERPISSAHSLQQALTILLETDLRLALTSLTHQTLLIHGDRDTLAPLQAAQWMTQTLKNANLQMIKGAAHASFLSHQSQFSHALIEFLQA